MTWNKCSEKLPEVGMLVILRTSTAFILGEPINRTYSAGMIFLDANGTPHLIQQNEYGDTLAFESLEGSDLEWKEVEKD